MAEPLKGLEVYLSTEKALEGAKVFQQAVENAAKAVESIGAVVDRLDKAFDKVGGGAKDAQPPIKKVGDEGKRTGEKFTEGGRKADDYGKRLRGLGGTASTVARQITTLLGAAGAITGIGAGVRAFADYEDRLQILGTVSGATKGQLEQLDEAARNLSRSSRISPSEAVAGLTELTRAGLSANEAIVALKPTADLARAGLISLSDSSAIVTKSLYQFGLAVEDAGRVADVLAAGASASNTSVAELADALARTGVAGRQFGVPIEDMSAAISVLQDNAIEARIAGTGLGRVLLQLRNPSDDASAALSRLRSSTTGLALTFADVNPQKVGLIGALKNLRDANLSIVDAVQLVGLEYGSVLSTLVDNVGKFEEAQRVAYSASGRSALEAQAGAQSLAAAFKDLSNAADEFAILGGRRGVGAVLAEISRTGADAIRVLSGSGLRMEEATTQGKALAIALQTVGTAIGAVVSYRVAAYFLTVATATKAAGVGMAALNAVVNANPLVKFATLLGTAAAAIIAFNSSASDAEIQAEKLERENRDLAESYEHLRKVALGVTKAPGKFQDSAVQTEALQKARREFAALGEELEKLGDQRVPIEKVLGLAELSAAGSQVDRIKRLLEQLPDVQRAAASAADAERRRLNATLPRSGPTFGDPNLRAFEINKGAFEAQQKVLKNLDAVYESLGITVDESGRRFISSADAIKAVNEALQRNDELAKAAGVSLAKAGDAPGLSSAVAGLVTERERELRNLDAIEERRQELVKLGKSEAEIATEVAAKREELQLTYEAQRRAGAALNDLDKTALSNLAKRIVDADKLERARRREAQEAEKLLKLQEELPKNTAELIRQYENEFDLTKGTAEEREVLRATIEAENDAKRIGLAIDTKEFDLIRQLAIESAKARSKERAEKRETKVDNRRDEALRTLADEENLVGLVGRERDRLRATIEAENDARRAGLEIGTAEFNDYVRRRQVLHELGQQTQAVAEIGGSVGGSVGGALQQITIEGEKARDAMRNLWLELQRLAFQQAVTNNLSNLFAQAGVGIASLFGGGPAAGTTGGTPGQGGTSSLRSQGFVTRLSGGTIPALSGQIITQPSYLERANRIYSVAEGGATTPEVVMRLAKDSRGNLGVAAVGAGGGGNTFVFPNVRSRQDARAVRATMSQRVGEFMAAAGRRGRRGLRPR